MNNETTELESKPNTCIHPLELRHAYRLLSTLPLQRKSLDEIEQLADRLAGARSLLELNRVIRPLRRESD